jgi:hypothetical protein
MARISEHRVQILERQTANLHMRVRELELQFADAPAVSEPAAPAPVAAWPPPTTAPVSTTPPVEPAAARAPMPPGAPAAERRPVFDL